MKVTLNWLREFVDLPDDPDVVAAALESLGHEIEGVEHLAPDQLRPPRGGPARP